jgi:hypothetical protein
VVVTAKVGEVSAGTNGEKVPDPIGFSKNH